MPWKVNGNLTEVHTNHAKTRRLHECARRVSLFKREFVGRCPLNPTEEWASMMPMSAVKATLITVAWSPPFPDSHATGTRPRRAFAYTTVIFAIGSSARCEDKSATLCGDH